MTGKPRTAWICCFNCLAEQVISIQGQLLSLHRFDTERCSITLRSAALEEYIAQLKVCVTVKLVMALVLVW